MADPVGPDVEAAPHEEHARKNHTDTNDAAIWEGLLNAAQKNGFGAVKNIEVEKVVVLSFRNLQLRRIAGLQDELLQLATTSINVETTSGAKVQEDTRAIDVALSAYEALRNYETLSLNALTRIPLGARLVGAMATSEAECEPIREKFQRTLRNMFGSGGFVMALKFLEGWDYFMALVPKTTQDSIIWGAIRILQDATMRESCKGMCPSKVVNILEMTAGDLGLRELDHRNREKRSQKQAFIQRIIMAMFGGAALIGPMLIMTLHPSLNTSLITVSVATFLFAMVLALVASDSAGKDVLAATAAYAAVLVVLVGTSMTPASSS